jgi:two-component system cell cycle sensor histidine kinase/response regulator CckA
VKSSRCRILILEDDPVVADSIADMLESFDYEVDVALTGEMAVRKYNEALESGLKYGVLILDVLIKGATGALEAMARIRRMDAEARAIVMSGFAKSRVLERFREYGFQGALTKPFTPERLISEIETAMA